MNDFYLVCDTLLPKIAIFKNFKCKFFVLFPAWLLSHPDS